MWWSQLPDSLWGEISICYSLNICVSLKFMCWNPNLQRWWYQEVGPLRGRCLGQEGKALMNGIGADIKEAPERSFALGQCEDRETRCQRETRGPSPECGHAGNLILDFQPPNYCLWVAQSVVNSNHSWKRLRHHLYLRTHQHTTCNILISDIWTWYES